MKLHHHVSCEVEKAFAANGLAGCPIILQTAKNHNLGDYQVNGVMNAAKKTTKSTRISPKIRRFIKKITI